MNGSVARCQGSESWSRATWTWPGRRACSTLVLAFLLLAAFFGAADPAAAQKQKRVALVIGNAAYTHTTPLENPGKDAVAMAKVLRRLDFEVILGTDLDQHGFFDKLEEFGDASDGADVTLFFYAGHGLQVDGENYLASIDAKLKKKLHLRSQTVKLDTVMENMRGNYNLVFLDACRDNPFSGELARSMGLTRTGATAARGLAPVSSPVQSSGGTLIAYATEPRHTADDDWSGGSNSPYTAGLLEHIERPGQSVSKMLLSVNKFVRSATKNRQVPWFHSSFPDELILVPGFDDLEREAATAYVRARTIDTVAAYREIIRQFPNTDEANLAQEQIKRLNSKAAYERARTEDTVAAYQEVINKFPGSEGARLAQGQITRLLDPIEELNYRPGMRIVDCTGCPRLVVVPAGNYTMGQLPSEKVQGYRFKPEVPEHPVTIAEKFAVGIHEVTFSQWDACHSDGGCSHRPGDNGWGRGDLPVIDVNWHDAKEYVSWLSRKTGKRYRLLSESEWEYVARGGTPAGPFHTGSTISTIQANYDGRDAGGKYRGRTVDVDDLASNAFGLYHVHGNVREWVEDCWHPDYHGAPGDGRAWIFDGICEERVIRGGSWRASDLFARFSHREEVDARRRYDSIGFRVARELGR